MMDKSQFKNMTTRQKAIAVVVILIVLIVLWQVINLFRGGSTKPAPSAVPAKNATTAGKPSLQGQGPTQPAVAPQPAQLPQQPNTTTQPQADLARMQQETQEKYLTALNELQMLRLTQQIAETNKDIAAAKLATVTAEKNIVDLLTKPAPAVETPASFTQGLAPGAPLPIQPGQQPAAAATSTTTVTTTTTSNYIVISVTKLLNRWSAVLGYQGKLYSVSVGDILPPDQSTIIAIDKSSVTLEKDGVVRKISLVPII